MSGTHDREQFFYFQNSDWFHRITPHRALWGPSAGNTGLVGTQRCEGWWEIPDVSAWNSRRSHCCHSCHVLLCCWCCFSVFRLSAFQLDFTRPAVKLQLWKVDEWRFINNIQGPVCVKQSAGVEWRDSSFCTLFQAVCHHLPSAHPQLTLRPNSDCCRAASETNRFLLVMTFNSVLKAEVGSLFLVSSDKNSIAIAQHIVI